MDTGPRSRARPGMSAWLVQPSRIINYHCSVWLDEPEPEPPPLML